jgi:rod shape-determining protein MreC
MYSLFQLLLGRFGPILTFLFLEGFCFFLIVRTNESQSKIFWSSANVVTGSMYKVVAGVRGYGDLKGQNRLLSEEIAKIRTQLAPSFYDNNLQGDTVSQRIDSTRLQRYTYLHAEIEKNSITNLNNMITINRGSLHGVKPEMGVISSDGVVGIVRKVSKHYALVMSVLHSQSKISASIRGSGYFGTLVWTGLDPRYLELQDIPKHTKVKVGQLVETSGFSTFFPAGILIGKVEAVDLPSGESNYRIKVRLNLEMSSIRHVYVVNNLHQDELKQLEQDDKDE